MPTRAQGNNVADISPDEVRQMLSNKEIQFIDVRELSEYEEGHIPGIKHIPLSEFVERCNDIDANKEVVVVCRSGNRSQQACNYLSSLGYKNLKNMVGGMNEWSGDIERGV